jgi:hypothetical protein
MFRISMLPAADGDCFLVETSGPAGTHRLLIDGGRQATARTYLRPLIATLAPVDSFMIDLMVLTHVDADHIEGLLDLLGADDAPRFRGVWFNDYRHLKIAAGLAPPEARPAPRTPVLGVRQGIDFATAVARHRCEWNAAFAGGPVMVEPQGQLPRFPLASGATVTLLGPPKIKLAAFLDEWTAEVRRLTKKTAVLARRQLPIPTVENLARLATERDEPDDKKPNGTSIAFVLAHEGRRVLFGADAHPDDLAHTLRRFEPGAERIRFDAVKVVHHGSAANNTSDLTGLLECPVWLVSTDGSRHRHPDPEAIARIVLAQGPGKKLLFNYATRYNQVWQSPDLCEKFNYQVQYAPEGQRTVINLTA